MATPVIAALPVAPTRGDGPDDYMVKADIFTAALPPFGFQVNTAVSWMADTVAATLDYKNAAAISATSAGNSVTQAGLKVVAAAEQVALATTQANNAATSASNALNYAAAAGASAGLPALVGNSRKVLTVKGDESGVEWKAIGQQIGDLMYSLNAPGAEYKLADGSIYLQASYPDYIAKVGLIPPSPPTTYDGTALSPDTGSNKYSLVMDANGVYFALGSSANNGTALVKIEIYKRVAGSITKLASINPVGSGSGIAASPALSFSGDGVYLAVAYAGSSPYVEVYKRSGDTFSKLTFPATQPANGVAFSDDGLYLGVTHDTTPFFSAFKRSGDTFSKLTTPVVGSLRLTAIACSGDGVYWTAITTSSNPNLALLKRVGDTFSIITPATTQPGAWTSIAMSKDGVYLACVNGSNTNTFVYKRTGDVFAFLKVVPNSGGTGATSSIWSPDGKYLFSGDASNMFGFRNTNDVFAPLSVSLSTGQSMLLAGHFDADYSKSYVVSYNGGANLIYGFKDAYPFNPLTEFQVPMAAAPNGTPGATNTSGNTVYSQIKAYVKMKEPA